MEYVNLMEVLKILKKIVILSFLILFAAYNLLDFWVFSNVKIGTSIAFCENSLSDYNSSFITPDAFSSVNKKIIANPTLKNGTRNFKLHYGFVSIGLSYVKIWTTYNLKINSNGQVSIATAINNNPIIITATRNGNRWSIVSVHPYFNEPVWWQRFILF